MLTMFVLYLICLIKNLQKKRVVLVELVKFRHSLLATALVSLML